MSGHVVREGPVLGAATVKERAEALAVAQGAKVRERRKQRGLTIEELSALSGLHSNTIGRIERGTSEASLEQLVAIAGALGLDPASLSPFADLTHVTGNPRSQGGLDDEAFVLIELLDVRVSGGSGAMNHGAEQLGRFAFSRDWLARKGVRPEFAKIVRARGDSMADKIHAGDILLVDTSVSTLDQEGVYVIELDGLDYVKVLQRDFATGGLKIISYNPAYPPIALGAEKAEALRITGRVVWRGGEM